MYGNFAEQQKLIVRATGVLFDSDMMRRSWLKIF